MTPIVPEVGLFVAFTAGVLSFLSPCVAPLVPAYLSYVSGMSVQDLTQSSRRHVRHILFSSLLFVLGFSLIFVLLGASASFVGDLLDEYRRPLTQIAGAVMILMGLFVIGLIPLPQLYREWRFHLGGSSLGRSGNILLGMVFAFGWTPCVGPILASILFYASSAETAGQGALLLLVYSLGLGVPFVLAGVAFGRALTAFKWVGRHYRLINIASGGLLVLVGILFLSGRFFYLNLMVQRLYYALFK